ncbi:hypothetical protein [Pedobacter africanus]|uniref:Uncharacterized protein n=1 Tax=Pedobacter africanus TaxID=151894 RepID=A0A1W2DFF8_9SPHI|nr:hypothetical protein [Pedobacter africanus]SMC96175.1 hypothetical protein SAMN04488524_3741 [Pedobacter africanus]
MNTFNIPSGTIGVTLIFLVSFFSGCSQSTPKATTEKTISSAVALPKIDVGNTERYVRLEIAVTHDEPL